MKILATSSSLITSARDPVSGMVTVDFRRRGYRGGCVQNGICLNEGRTEYSGRGWMTRLVADAVVYLDEAMHPRKKRKK